MLSAGWIVPLCTAFSINRDFLWKTYREASGAAVPMSWHPFEWADDLFYLSMAWLSIVVIVWSYRATR